MGHLERHNSVTGPMQKKSKGLPLLIVEIDLSSVQRPGDWVGFTWRNYDGTH